MSLLAFLRVLLAASIVAVVVIGAFAVYLIGQYARYGENPPPQCAPNRRQLLERTRTLPPPLPLSRSEASDLALWEAELR